MDRTRTPALALAAALALTSLSIPAFAQEAASPAAAPPEAPLADDTTTPSAVTAADLLASLPGEIEGMPLTTSTFEAANVLAGVESDALLLDMADLALEYDTELNRFGVAGGGGVDGEAFVSIIGAHLPGAPAEALQDAFIRIILGPTDPELQVPGEVAGHEVTVIRASTDAGPADTAYLLPVDEVIWLVIADETSLRTAVEALAGEA